MEELTSEEIAWIQFKVNVFNGLSARSRFDRESDIETLEEKVYEVLDECRYLLAMGKGINE